LAVPKQAITDVPNLIALSQMVYALVGGLKFVPRDYNAPPPLAWVGVLKLITLCPFPASYYESFDHICTKV